MAKATRDQVLINNDFYEWLGEEWYTAQDHPIALLRAENALRAPWVAEKIETAFKGPVDLLDIGCGGGFLSNFLAHAGHRVTGIDLSEGSLNVARRHDDSGKAIYLHANAYELPFTSNSFDVVCAMDILEHVNEPDRLIREARRVLRPGGLFFFHTFNRTWQSYFLVIKGVEWFVRNAPKNMHVYNLFITPKELKEICRKSGMEVRELVGFVPRICHPAIWRLLFTGKIHADFSFKFTKRLLTGYCGIAVAGS